MIFETALQILKTTVGIKTNHRDLLPMLPPKIEVKSLLTCFNTIKEISVSDHPDGTIEVENHSSDPSFKQTEDSFHFRGQFLKISESASDLRYSLWGNQGFLYRFALTLLEKKHSLFNLHACALYDELSNHLYVIAGGAGQGKTVFLLSGLQKGLKLFSTETVHFKIDNDGQTWFPGPLVDNVRLGSLIYDFPLFLPEENLEKQKSPWETKIALDLSQYAFKPTELINPESVSFLFPRVEHGFQGYQINPIEDKRKSAQILFNNITEKIAESVLLYDRFPVPGLDTNKLAAQRLSTINQLLSHKNIRQTAAIITNPKECWNHLIKTRSSK